MRQDFDLRRNVSLRLLLLRLQEISCVQFSPHAAKDLMTSPLPFFFTDSDIGRVEAYAKTLHLVSFSEANICYLRAMQCPDRYSNETLRLYLSAVEHLESALDKATTNLRIMFLLASSLYHISMICYAQSIDERKDDSEQVTEDESESGTEEIDPLKSRASSVDLSSQQNTKTANVNSNTVTVSSSSSTTATPMRRFQVQEKFSSIESMKYLSKANSTLERLMQLCSVDQSSTNFIGHVHYLWGLILNELGNQLRHYSSTLKRHPKFLNRAVVEYKHAFSNSQATKELRESLGKEVVEELSASNRSKSSNLASHKLHKLHLQCLSYLEFEENMKDVEMVLITAELEVILSKRVTKVKKMTSLMNLALSRFVHLHQKDPSLITEYYSRKRNVIFSIAQGCSSNSKNAAVLKVIVELFKNDNISVQNVMDESPVLSRDSNGSSHYPISTEEYNLIHPIRDKEGYTDSSGTLWEARCLSTQEIVAIKVVDSSTWKRIGRMPDQIVKRRRKIKSDKIVHFLQVFEDPSSSCTWFVMPLYMCSAYALTRKYLDLPAKILLCIVKLAIEALIELHEEGIVHSKLTMRNVLIVELPNDRYSIKLTNKTPYIINTLIYRSITGAQDTFSPSRFAKALKDYDGSPNPNFIPDESEDDGELSSSGYDTTPSYGSTTGGLSDFFKKEEKGSQSININNNNNNNNETDDYGMARRKSLRWSKIGKAEDVLAVVRMLARVYDMQLRRLKQERGLNRSSKTLNEELGDWDDLLPFINAVGIGQQKMVENPPPDKLPTLQELLKKKVLFSQADPEKELTFFLRKKKFIQEEMSEGSSGSIMSPPFMLQRESAVSSKRQSPSASPSDIEEAPTPPEEISFASGSKREKLLSKLEEASRRLKMSSKKSSPFVKAGSSPRGMTKQKSVFSLVPNIVNCVDKKKQGSRTLVTLFSASPPTPHMVEEFDLDWVCTFIVFFYNKTWLLWNNVTCTCSNMEAGKGKWLWRLQKTGQIVSLPARLYMRYLMGAFHESIHKLNVLNAKISFDLQSSQRIYSEFRDHLRRLVRLFLHLAYNPDHYQKEVESEPSSDTDAEMSPVTPRSTTPQSSPRPFGKASSLSRTSGKRLSKDKKILQQQQKEKSVEIPAQELWEILLEFCQLFHVDLAEVSMMKQPLFE